MTSPAVLGAANDDDAFLSVTGVGKSFGGREVLSGIDLAVPQGGSVAVVGPSGCGKTTLLRIIAGFERPDCGAVALGGRVLVGDGRAVPAHRRGIGYVPQDGALFPHLTIAGNVGFGLPRRERTAQRIAELLERVALGPQLARLRPDQLSGGQQQRVAVARALAQSPSVVLLDEPFSALDAGLRAEIRAAVAEVLRGAGVTALLVTHDHEEALSFADRAAVLRDGRFVQVGTPREVYLEPVDEHAAAFFGEVVRVRGKAGSGVVCTPLGDVPVPGEVPATDAVEVLLRTEQIVLVPDSDRQGAGAAGTVRTVTFLGSAVRCEVEVPGVGLLIARCRPQDAPEPGDRVSVSVAGAGRLARYVDLAL